MPRPAAQTARITDITLTTMTITTAASGSKSAADDTDASRSPDARVQTHVYALTPPMTSLRDVRPRLIELDARATTQLSPTVAVTQYAPPRGIHLVHFITCIVLFTIFSQPAPFEPPQMLHRVLATHLRVPRFAAFCSTMQPVAWWTMAVMHSAEAALLGRRLSVRHGVAPTRPLWWVWVASCLVEGGTSWRR